MIPEKAECCSICQSKTKYTFSNRPLHKGKQETLLVCSSCIDQASQLSGSVSVTDVCNWCGNKKVTMVSLKGYTICESCITLCQSIYSRV